MTIPDCHNCSAPPNMEAVYDDLAEGLRHHLKGNKQRWIGIAGGPGSGKTTSAEAVTDRLNKMHPNSAVVLPMDGFHYTKEKLRELDPPDGEEYLARRGSPWTYDADLMVNLLSKAKKEGKGTFPTYDREKHDPIEGGVVLCSEHKVVFIEGLYLFCKDDERFAPLYELWDEKWFIKAPTMEEQRDRVVERSLKTWDEGKVKRFGEGIEGAKKRAEANDVKNMKTVDKTEQYADMVILTKSPEN